MEQHQDLPPGLSDAQDKLLAVLPIPSSVLSIIGSSVIIYMLLHNHRGRGRGFQQRRWTPYTRLLLGMSICDIISSISIAAAGFLRPRGSLRAWAFGNDATCTAAGFLIQFSWSGMLYYNMLFFYFLFTTRFGLSNSFIGKRIEPFMHLISVGYPFVTGVVGAVWGVYAETSASFGCWVNDYPRGCTDDCKSVIIGWIFYGIPFWISSLTLAVNNIAIFLFVRSQTTSRRPDLSRTNASEQTARDMTCNDGDEKLDDSQSQQSFGCDPPLPPQIPSQSQSTMLTDEFASKASLDPQSHQIKRFRLVRTQALLFVITYALCVAWGALVIFLESLATTKAEEISMTVKYFPVLVGNAIFAPLAGFLNMLVFLRPKYLRWKHRSPHNTNMRGFCYSLLVGNTSRPREKGPTVLPEPAEKKSNNDKTNPAEKNKIGNDPASRLQKCGVSSPSASFQTTPCTQERQQESGGDRNADGWLSSSSDSICTHHTGERSDELRLPAISELSSSIFDSSTQGGISSVVSRDSKHSSGSNTTLSSRPAGTPAVRHSWQSEERWNPNQSPMIAKGSGVLPCDQIPETPGRARREGRCRWSSIRSSSPTLRETLDSKLSMPQRVGSEVDQEAEVKIVPTIPTLEPLTELLSPPQPSKAAKASSA
ncbi:unnamed protein product [Cylindrotheca closterium]|uniref:G-protein coupled receptors family 2 profile 2 domain-containing protein n=1 Tax=Cylindrotheca closterium TaxID=2856 RepID=A0AAD2CLZ1_9STRA|nr:unnamed protein product [Cylindrotheca closterium]